MTKVLILDQSKSVRNILRERLEYEGFSAEAVENEAAASALCERIPFDVILSDTECKVPDAGIPFIALSADTSIDTAVKAVRNGAQDFLTKPIDMNRLLQSLHRTIDNPAPAQAPPAAPPVRRRRAHSAQAERIIGVSPEIEHVRQLIDKVAPCEARVLITGENGTGKELVARWLHAKSVRAAAPFVEVNCAAIPSELIESELFGHEKGAFTDADKNKSGRIEIASGGTLFLNEIGNLPLMAQSKLLTVIEQRKINRVGSTQEIPIDIRLISATNTDLHAAVQEGHFRQDLLYRINTIEIIIPPLRERGNDVTLLARHFLQRYCQKYKKEIDGFSDEAYQLLKQYNWPGNVRELQHVIERAVILSETRQLQYDDFMLRLPVSNSQDKEGKFNLEELEKNTIQEVLRHCSGNMTQAASLLGITRTSLYRRLEKYSL